MNVESVGEKKLVNEEKQEKEESNAMDEDGEGKFNTHYRDDYYYYF